MDGDLAPLSAILSMAKRAGAMLVLDEAHSTGVLGKTGRGILEHFSQAWHPNLAVTGTLSKALGSLGGYVAGPRALIDWLVNSSRSFIFSTALPASCAAAALEALKLIQEEPERLQRLRLNRERLASGLEKSGWDIGGSASPIIPLIVGAAWQALELQDSLWKGGFYVPAIRPPTVPAGACRLRLSVSSEHSEAQIDGLLEALGEP
jgi:8-amino-7-oxononanoate synthase